jgi:hypothetical protein
LETLLKLNLQLIGFLVVVFSLLLLPHGRAEWARVGQVFVLGYLTNWKRVAHPTTDVLVLRFTNSLILGSLISRKNTFSFWLLSTTPIIGFEISGELAFHAG